MNIVTDNTDGYPTPPDGGKLYELTEAQEAERKAAFAQPNGGVKFDGMIFTALPAPPPPAPLTPEQKLAASGLTVAEIKTLLGMN